MPHEWLERVASGYVRAALWSSTDDDGNGLDDSGRDLAPDTLEQMRRDAFAFDLAAGDMTLERGDPEQAGHDFWLTRNHHGAGFWDGDWPEHGDALTDLAHEWPEVDLYVGDDGMIHQSPIQSGRRVARANA